MGKLMQLLSNNFFLNISKHKPYYVTISKTRKFRKSTFININSSKNFKKFLASEALSDKKEWSAVIANADFFFNEIQNESFAEQLRERARFYDEKGLERDFWIVPNPVWINEELLTKAKFIRRPCVALVSTNPKWIIYMKLRLDRVIKINLGNISKKEALNSNGKLPDFKSSPEESAPYDRYSYGWWEPYLPDNRNEI